MKSLFFCLLKLISASDWKTDVARVSEFLIKYGATKWEITWGIKERDLAELHLRQKELSYKISKKETLQNAGWTDNSNFLIISYKSTPGKSYFRCNQGENACFRGEYADDKNESSSVFVVKHSDRFDYKNLIFSETIILR